MLKAYCQFWLSKMSKILKHDVEGLLSVEVIKNVQNS